MNIYLVFFLAGIIILAALILFFMNIGKSRKQIIDVEGYRVKCLAIEHQLKKGEFHEKTYVDIVMGFLFAVKTDFFVTRYTFHHIQVMRFSSRVV